MREHQDVVRHVADRGDLLGRDRVALRQEPCDRALVRERVRDVEVVRLRAGRRDAVAELVVRSRSSGRHRIVIVAHTNDLGDTALHAVEVVDHGRLELHRLGLAVHVRAVGIDHEPVRPTVEPGVEAERCEQLHGATDQLVRDDPVLDDAHVGLDDEPAVERRDR